jgi:hypothetical protein
LLFLTGGLGGFWSWIVPGNLSQELM